MATKRAPKPKPPKPAQHLRDALEFFRSVGMKKGDLVTFGDGVAVFDNGFARFQADAPELSNATLEGVALLAIVKELPEAPTFTFSDDGLLIIQAGDRSFWITCQQDQAIESIVDRPSRATLSVDAWSRFAELAGAVDARLLIVDSRLVVYSGTHVAEHWFGKGDGGALELPTGKTGFKGLDWTVGVTADALDVRAGEFRARVGAPLRVPPKVSIPEFPKASSFVEAGELFAKMALVKKAASDEKTIAFDAVRIRAGKFSVDFAFPARGEFEVAAIAAVKKVATFVSFRMRDNWPLLYWHDGARSRGVVSGLATRSIDD